MALFPSFSFCCFLCFLDRAMVKCCQELNKLGFNFKVDGLFS